MLIASHRTCFPDLDRLSQFIPQLPPPFFPTAILFSHSLLLYDIDFIHNSLPPILGRASVGVREPYVWPCTMVGMVGDAQFFYYGAGGWPRTVGQHDH